MPTLTDSKFTALRGLGHTGAMPDMTLQWLKVNGATSSSLTDAWAEMLASKGVVDSQRSDAWYTYLDGLAPVTVGRQGNDLELWYWASLGP